MDYPYRSQWDPDATARNNDCGPACVAMVLAAFGQDVPINAISAEIMPGGDVGTDARDLVNELTKRGIKADTWVDVSGYPAWPAICLVKYAGFERANVQDKGFMGWHWMLVLSLSDSTVVCHDPDFAWTRRNEGAFKCYSRREFDAAFVPYGDGKVAVIWKGQETSPKAEQP